MTSSDMDNVLLELVLAHMEGNDTRFKELVGVIRTELDRLYST